jgi:hypothetical protein
MLTIMSYKLYKDSKFKLIKFNIIKLRHLSFTETRCRYKKAKRENKQK